jgi:hypothetical protein
MSSTISIAIRQPPPFTATLEALALADVRCLEPAPDAGAPWPHGIWHLYRDGVSTRTTEITCSEDEFAIRIFSLASIEDVALAVALAQQVATSCDVREVDAEPFGPTTVAQLPERYDSAWAESQAESGLRALAALIADGRGPMTVPGPRRTVCIGPRMLKELDGDHRALWTALRRIQWLPVRTAGEYVTKSSAKREIKLAIWLGEEVVFPAVDYAALSLAHPDREPEVFLIPAERVPELAGPRWQRLDEVQGVIAAFDADAWRELVERARAFATKP